MTSFNLFGPRHPELSSCSLSSWSRDRHARCSRCHSGSISTGYSYVLLQRHSGWHVPLRAPHAYRWECQGTEARRYEKQSIRFVDAGCCERAVIAPVSVPPRRHKYPVSPLSLLWEHVLMSVFLILEGHVILRLRLLRLSCGSVKLGFPTSPSVAPEFGS